ncbi:putative ribonucleotide reductase large subunit [Campylobacter phage F207]|uniref:Putative ribonucleotide reductase large subunit n=1 Tax=Campylobacter phage F207 TaxID=2794360 RepID=A0A7T3KCY7_9CAUD|nr:putative ribonucleotide reductase large subunit [Campylobacter phage F207]
MNEINVVKTYTNGEIALCNLASINLHEYDLLSDTEKYNLIYDIVSTMDNTIDLAYYMVKDAQTANKKYRYLGIGVSNLAVLLAKHKIIIDSQESLEFQAKLFDELLYNCVKASMQLAIEKGRAEGFNETKWAKGLYPYLIGNKKAKKLIKFKPDEDKWNKLMEDVKKYGLRNCALTAIAPTACVTKETKIKTENGIKSYKDIMKEQGINFNEIENYGIPSWIDFKVPFKVQTRHGLKEVNRIWFNGKQPTKTITFEDNTILTLTYNHKLLVKLDSGIEEWIEARDLKKGMEIVSITNNIKIKSISNNTDVLFNTWDIEVPDVHEYLLENGCISHNTSGRSINASESIEPIQKLLYKEDGNINIKTLAPMFKEYNQYYKLAQECDPMMLIKAAAVRQLFLDQSQSVNMYSYTFNGELNYIQKSSHKLSLLHMYAHQLGLKTLYYFKSEKDNGVEHECESCS